MLLGVLMVFAMSQAVLLAYCAKTVPLSDQVAWADGLIEYYLARSSDPKLAETFGQYAYNFVLVETGLSRRAQSTSTPTIFDDTKARLRRLQFWEVFERSVYLFGVRLGQTIQVVPVLLLLLLVYGHDGWIQRSIRRTSAGKESASVYHRAKKYSSSLIIPFIAAIYLCSPVKYEPMWLFLPFILVSALMVRMQMTYYKKYF